MGGGSGLSSRFVLQGEEVEGFALGLFGSGRGCDNHGIADDAVSVCDSRFFSNNRGFFCNDRRRFFITAEEIKDVVIFIDNLRLGCGGRCARAAIVGQAEAVEKVEIIIARAGAGRSSYFFCGGGCRFFCGEADEVKVIGRRLCSGFCFGSRDRFAGCGFFSGKANEVEIVAIISGSSLWRWFFFGNRFVSSEAEEVEVIICSSGRLRCWFCLDSRLVGGEVEEIKVVCFSGSWLCSGLGLGQAGFRSGSCGSRGFIQTEIRQVKVGVVCGCGTVTCGSRCRFFGGKGFEVAKEIVFFLGSRRLWCSCNSNGFFVARQFEIFEEVVR